MAALRGGLPNFAVEGLQLVNGPVAANPGLDLLSTTRAVMGGSFLDFTITTAILLVLAIGAAILCVRRQPQAVNGPGIALAAAGIAVGAGVFLMLPVVSPLLSGPYNTLRFLTPTLIGSTVAILILAGDLIPGRKGGILALGLSAIGTALFWPTMIERVHYAWQYHTIRAFPHATEPLLLDYIHDSVGAARRDQIAKLQAQVPVGEPIIAWVGSPYFLDFRRNPIIDVELAGTATPWAAQALAMNARYVIWQHQGLVMEPFDYLRRAPRASWAYDYDRRMHRAAAAFASRLAGLVQTGALIGSLHDKDESWVVVRLPPQPK